MPRNNLKGRPSEYREEMCELVKEPAENGATDAQIAEILGVSTNTFYRWRNTIPAFRVALNWSKQKADDLVERSLFIRAVGYTFESEKVSFGKNGEVLRAATLEHVPPDTTAQIFWLKNRKPDQYRDQRDITSGGKPLTLVNSIPPIGS